MASGQPLVCVAASGCTKSRTCGGLASSKYFLSFQLLTTAPRFENSTRYRSFSTAMVRSCDSARGSLLTAGAVATTGGWPPGLAGLAEAGGFADCAGLELVGVVDGADWAGRFAPGGVTGGLGPKYFAQTKITTIES